jgi:ATP-dependent DNA helicase RecG
MKAESKDKIMQDFKDKKINILVSTSVVEVGVDIPNATIIFIEGAERFGLSQLHQFRGRIGRAEYQSYCYLSTEIWSDIIKNRLKIIETINDGFKISEADLKLRGPGEVYGTRQHGLADLRFASIFDQKMIRLARREAQRLIIKDPSLKSWPKLILKLSQFEKETHME